MFVVSFLELVESASFTGYVQRNHHHSFWAIREQDYQDNNYIFDMTCIKALVNFYRRYFPGRQGKRLHNVADGCRGQYKSKFVCNILSTGMCDELEINEYVSTFYASGDGKSQCDGTGKDGPQYIRQCEKSGICRCADAWEVFKFLTGAKAPPQPLSCSNIADKKKFSLDFRKQHFVINEEKATDEMKELKLFRDDIHFVLQSPEGHRENTVDVKGISDVYQLRAVPKAVNNGRSIIYLREDVCCCKFCVVSDYERCVKGVPWKACDITVSNQKDVVRQMRIAKFYHLSTWDQANMWFNQRPPIVALRLPSDEQILMLGLLKSIPFQLDEALYLKRQDKAVRFRASKGTWCLKIDLLKVPDGVELNSHIYIVNTLNDHNDIIVPVYETLMPNPIDESFWAYSEFISCVVSESYRKHGGTQVYVKNFKINHRSMTALLRML